MNEIRFSEANVDPERLEQYVRLFKVCFPDSRKFSKTYLEWLYAHNPSGTVVGVDALHDDKVVAHYAVIPVEADLGGHRLKACWSLNTATHPAYQGRGLFTRLAEMTYELATARGCAAVMGVANKNSSHGFVRKLGFAHLGQLSVSAGYGAINLSDREDALHRAWPREHQEWRLKNPANTYYAELKGTDALIYTAVGPTCTPVVLGYVKGQTKGIEKLQRLPALSRIQPRIFIGFGTTVRGIVLPVPERILPSPWNVICRPLAGFSYGNLKLAMMGIDLDTF